jgi:MoxR-like ATPase
MKTIDELLEQLKEHGYVADRSFATALFLVLKMGRPLLIEGHAGVGKTESAKVLASLLETDLIRLQCYEGLDVSSAIYEWNYQKQLLAIKIQEGTEATVEEKEKHVFGPEFLMKRPLLRAITAEQKSPVLLIDEIDRADEEFEAFLLEVLSDFQISIPEMKTIRATHIPYVILTSNRTRELSDALKRRCLYHWIEYPSLEKELQIVSIKLPQIEIQLAEQLVRFVQQIRQKNLSKPPGVAETLDWAAALLSLGRESLTLDTVDETLGCILKSKEDIDRVQRNEVEAILTSGKGT